MLIPSSFLSFVPVFAGSFFTGEMLIRKSEPETT
jgi:hypothetical protein